MLANTIKQTTIKRSVFVFLRSVFYIEFFFSFLPLLLAFLLNLQAEYEGTALAGRVPYSLLALIVVTLLQVLAVAAAFATWYLPAYAIDPDRVVLLRSNLVENRKLADIADILGIKIRQGWLGRRLNYGTLVLTLEGEPGKATLRDVPDPAQVAETIESFMAVNRTQRALPEAVNVAQVAALGEGQFVEFKSSLVWDYHQQRANKTLYEPVMKTLAAFMNSRGGTLLIGVNDQGEPLGLDQDYSTMRKPNADGFELAFNSTFNKMIGVQNRRFVELSFPLLGDKEICAARVSPAPEPVFLTHNDQEFFYIRAGNASQALSFSQAETYIRSHFSS
jgi:membrane protein YdbS with pleckstrin-like domain